MSQPLVVGFCSLSERPTEKQKVQFETNHDVYARRMIEELTERLNQLEQRVEELEAELNDRNPVN